MSKPAVYEVGIVGRITWDLHSLNNEGSIGNVSEPRTVMLADGTKSDGVSGEMLKHVHVQALWQIARDKLPLCSSCRNLEPSRANAEQAVTGAGDEASAMKKAIEQCAICDLHGFLVERPTINRSSCLEFGWAVALPDHCYRDLHVHARHAVGVRARPRAQERNRPASQDDTSPEDAEQTEAAGEAAPTSQMVYHRPTRSGVYAVLTVFMPWRIGLEHITYNYVITPEDRLARYQHALRAYQAMFWRTEGAMTTTRLPHIYAFEGTVVVSTTNLPVPVVSALADDYQDRLARLAEAAGGLQLHPFGDLVEFTQVLNALADNYEPYTLSKQG